MSNLYVHSIFTLFTKRYIFEKNKASREASKSQTVLTNCCNYFSWNPSPPPPGRCGDNFIGPWGILRFQLPLGELSQTRGLKFSTFFWGGDNAGFPPNPLNSTFLLKIFFSEQYHDIKNALTYKVNCNLKLPLNPMKLMCFISY